MAPPALVLIDLMDRIVGLPLGPRPGSEVLDRCIQLATAFRRSGATVVAVRVERPNVTEQPPGSSFAAGVVEDGDLVIVKRTVGAFTGTDLHALLQARGIDRLVLAGIATNMGVESTARVASDLDYELVFVEDAMTALTSEEHDAAIAHDFPRFGSVVRSADVLADTRFE